MVVGVFNRSSYGLVMFIQLPFPGKYVRAGPQLPDPVVPGGTAGPSQDDSDLDGGPFPFVVRVRSRRQCTSQRRSVYVSVEKTITHNRGVRVRLLNISRLQHLNLEVRTYSTASVRIILLRPGTEGSGDRRR